MEALENIFQISQNEILHKKFCLRFSIPVKFEIYFLRLPLEIIS